MTVSVPHFSVSLWPLTHFQDTADLEASDDTEFVRKYGVFGQLLRAAIDNGNRHTISVLKADAEKCIKRATEAEIQDRRRHMIITNGPNAAPTSTIGMTFPSPSKRAEGSG
jgi:hypothetical protein